MPGGPAWRQRAASRRGADGAARQRQDRAAQLVRGRLSRRWSGGRRIGLLSRAAARDALIKPLETQGVGIDFRALIAVIDESQRYPYFIQLCGEALWKRCLTSGASGLTIADAQAAHPHVTALITDYYQDRYRELETRGLLPAAVAVAPLFAAGASTATDRDLDTALAATGDDAAGRLAARDELNRLPCRHHAA